MEQRMMENQKEVMTAEEVSDYLLIPISTIYKLAQEGKINGRKIGKHWRFMRQEIQDKINAQPVAAAEGNGNGNGNGKSEFAVKIENAELMNPPQRERRGSPRLNCAFPSHFAVDLPGIKHCEGDAVVLNVGVGGALIEVREMTIQGQSFHLDDPILVMSDSKNLEMKIGPFTLDGRIVRVHEEGEVKVAFAFRKVDSKTLHAIADYVGYRFSGELKNRILENESAISG